MKNRILVAILPVLACFAFLPGAQAQVCQDGCDAGLFNAFQGTDALKSGASIGVGNAAFGWRALFFNDGNFNTGIGGGALALTTSGANNTAVGAAALLLNITGNDNVAVGTDALVNSSGNDNVAVGEFAGSALLVANNVIAIGTNVSGELSDSTYIANIAGASIDLLTASAVGVDADGKLGTVGVDAAGNKVPLSSLFSGQRQAMLNRKVQELQNQVEVLTAQLKEQAAQIQRVSAQLEVRKPATKVVVNKP